MGNQRINEAIELLDYGGLIYDLLCFKSVWSCWLTLTAAHGVVVV